MFPSEHKCVPSIPNFPKKEQRNGWPGEVGRFAERWSHRSSKQLRERCILARCQTALKANPSSTTVSIEQVIVLLIKCLGTSA
jgi:hypothetical protein